SKVCKKKPKFVERGHKHPYCSRTWMSSSSGPSPTSTASPATPAPTPTSNTCLLAGCNFQAQSNCYGFCDLEHAREAVRLGQVEACEMCRDQPRFTGSGLSRMRVGGPSRKLCVGCDRAARGGAQLRELGNKDSNPQTVYRRMDYRPRRAPTVDKVYQVLVPREELGRYAAYRKNLNTPQEIRTYHASLVVCDLGTKGPFLCERTSCGVCTVVRSSFHSFAFEEQYNQGRFGPGIYTSTNPRLADRHATSCISSPYRVMVACDTLLEADYQVSIANQLKTESDGFLLCFLFQVSSDEPVFVGIPDAINAAYVIMYSM
ncbi:hypothetical protein BT96DRAFT_840684, partial [Gymnopus androsaceus JB14]